MEVSEAYPQTHALSSVGQTRSHQCRGVLQTTGGGGELFHEKNLTSQQDRRDEDTLKN